MLLVTGPFQMRIWDCGVRKLIEGGFGIAECGSSYLGALSSRRPREKTAFLAYVICVAL